MKPRVLLLAVAVLAVATVARAEDKKPIEPGPWKFGTTMGLNLSQSAFSTNWAGGDRGSLVWVLSSLSSGELSCTSSNDLKSVPHEAFSAATLPYRDCRYVR